MSLMNALGTKTSPAALFFQSQCPEIKNFGNIWRSMVRDLSMLKPPVKGQPESSVVGIAVDYRIRLYLRSYPASDTVAWSGANRKIILLDSRAGSDSLAETTSLKLKDRENVQLYFKKIWIEVSNIWENFSTRDTKNVKFEDQETEYRIAAVCLVFAYFEGIYRRMIIPEILILAYKNAWNAEDIIENLNETTIDDVYKISKIFFESNNAINSSRDLYLNPTFSGSSDVGGADADFIADGCLWDIKTVTDPTKNFQKWPYQLLGYSFLDYNDEFSIRSVGIYLSRQGKWISWPLSELIGILGGDSTIPIETWRSMFKSSLQNVRTVYESQA